MIWYLPLESIEQRYTPMMNAAIMRRLEVYMLYPEVPRAEGTIQNGEFLDVTGTIEFKMAQMRLVAERFSNGEVKSGDVFLVADMFYPGIESIRYMADLLNIKVRIIGFNYAGRADRNDFVQRLGQWADIAEKTYHEVCDYILVGSHDHQTNVMNKFDLSPQKVIVSGLVWDIDYVEHIYQPDMYLKEDFIIFPHRLAAEKGLTLLLAYAEYNSDRKIVITSSGARKSVALPKNVEYAYGLSKKQYYAYLNRARYYVSFARQETFGYTLQEAIVYGCRIAVPSQACYPEMIPPEYLFSTHGSIYEMSRQIDDCWNNPPVDREMTRIWNGLAEQAIMKLIERGGYVW